MSALAHRAVVLLLFAIVVSVALLSSSAPAYAATDDASPSRALAIGYDNSSSMITDTDKWCGANYSLEVLAAMLDENDEMVVYTMEEEGQKLAVSGATDAASRVSQVHETDLQISNQTEPHAAREASEYLQSSSAEEKFLIITTDGEFTTGGKLDEVKEIVQDAASKGITVIYLAIGSDAETIDEDPDHGIYVKSAPDSNAILGTMVDIANQVFGRDALPESSVGGSQLNFDVPMAEFIVFAQGPEVEVGALTTADGTVINGEQAKVRYKDSPSADTSYGTGLVNEDLQGVVCAFRGQIPKGEATLDINGATNVEIYYTPYVGIALDMTESNTAISYRLQPGQDNQLSAGTYDVQPYFVDPISGERVESDLLKDPVFDLAVQRDGEEQHLESGSQLSIEPGTLSIDVTAVTNETVRLNQSYPDINVAPAVSVMTLDVSAVPSALAVVDFASKGYPVSVQKASGEPITEEEWAQMELTVEDDAGVVWKVEKGTEIGTATVQPQWTDGNAWKTQRQLVGTFPLGAKASTLHFTAETATTNEVFRANEEKKIAYTGDWMSVLRHLWLPLLLLLIALFLLFKYITKPRLPRKMRPHIVLPDVDNPVALSYSEKRITNRYSPFGPERVVFNAQTPKDATMAGELGLYDRYELGRIGLVAAKKEGKNRKFVFDEQTLAEMRRHIKEAQEREESGSPGFPNPDYQPKPAKSFKDQKSSRSMGSTIGFKGFDVPPLGQRRSEQEYRLYFKKPS